MFPQQVSMIREQWKELDNKSLAQIFMDSAQRLNGTPVEPERLCEHSGMLLDRRIAQNDAEVVGHSVYELMRRFNENDQSGEDSFLKPMVDALMAAQVNSKPDPRVIATTLKDVVLPDVPFVKKPTLLVLF